MLKNMYREQVKEIEGEIKMDRFFTPRNEAGRLRVDGSAVRRARWAACLTQADIASRMERLGYYLPQPYVSLLESGKYRWGFTERMATALAATLGVGTSEITGAALTLADAQRIPELVSELDEVVGPDTGSSTQGQVA
jgi:hypothetical protein